MRWVVVGAFFLVFCAPATSTAPLAGESITYSMATDWDGAAEHDGTRVFETSVGYTVEIDELRIGVGSLELVPCATASVFGLSVARADHYWGEDSSRLDAYVADSLTLDDPLVVGEASASGAMYCEAFWTIEAVDAFARDGVPQLDSAIRIEGRVTRDGVTQELSVETRLGDGAIVALDGEWAQGSVLVTRHPVRAFDAIDFATLSDTEIAYEVLRELGRTSTATAH